MGTLLGVHSWPSKRLPCANPGALLRICVEANGTAVATEEGTRVAALAELVFTTFVEGYVRMATCVAFARVSFSPLHTDAGVWLHAAALGAPVPSGSVAARGRARGAGAYNACSCPTSTGRQRGLAGLRAALGRVSLLARHGPVALRDGVYGVLLARPGAGRVAGRSAGVCGEGPAVRVRMLRRRRPNPARCTRVVRCCGACTHTRDMRGQVHVHERACMLKHTHQHEAHK